MPTAETVRIEGASAAEIVGSVRSLVARGVLEDGSLLPPVRVLADQLSLNRNTVAAAYSQLAERGVVEGRGRGGTVVASPARLHGEGSSSAVPAVDLAGGNPDPALVPDLRAAFGAVTSTRRCMALLARCCRRSASARRCCSRATSRSRTGCR